MPVDPPVADERLPDTPAARFLVGVLVAFVAGALLLEVFWRTQGYTPSVTDDEALWAQHRARVNNAPDDTLLLLGRSRLHQGFVADVFREAFPDRPYIQLATGGKHALGTLRNVALETDFSGTVLCSITSASLLPELWDQQEDLLQFYTHQWGPVTAHARRLQTGLQDHLTFLLPDLLLQRVGPDLLRWNLPRQFLWTYPDRTQTVDYRRVNLEEFTAIQLQKITDNTARYAELPGYKSWPDHLDEIDSWVQRIQDRGGRVIFLRMPTTGEYRQVEIKTFPRAAFWDRFAKQTSAETWHFEDIPELAAMTCAEGTHLHTEDAQTFTEVICRKL
jgi:hypothetical protein